MKTVEIKQDMESHASAFQEGRQAGIRYLFDAWYPSLCEYVTSLINDHSSAEEISSEAFLKTWNYRHQFNCADEIRAYLYTIAKHDAFRLLQQRQKNRHLADHAKVAQNTSWLSPAPIVETGTLICEAISELPPRCRRICELLFLEGKETNEVAAELFISPYTVRAQKARGIHLLRSRLLTAFG